MTAVGFCSRVERHELIECQISDGRRALCFTVGRFCIRGRFAPGIPRVAECAHSAAAQTSWTSVSTTNTGGLL